MDDIPVKYVNGTKSTDFQVVVFSKNFSMISPTVSYSAWQVLNAQTSVQFTYTESVSVGATYKTSGQIITAGPFSTDLGSTWEIKQPLKTDTAELTQSKILLLHQSLNNNSICAFCMIQFYYVTDV